MGRTKQPKVGKVPTTSYDRTETKHSEFHVAHVPQNVQNVQNVTVLPNTFQIMSDCTYCTPCAGSAFSHRRPHLPDTGPCPATAQRYTEKC